MIYTADEIVEALERELSYRRRVYGRLVGEGKMLMSHAKRQIGIFEQLHEEYAAKAKRERLL